MKINNSKIIVPGVLLCALIFFAAGNYLVRPLWFDEALTVQNFALLESIPAIYRNYVIPNNQLLYTMMLHIWIKLYGGFFAIDGWMRLLSLLLAAVTLVYTFRRFRVAYGTGVMAVILITFCLAPPFLLHATALRGYMAGACFTILALGAALDYTGSGKAASWARYFFFSLCSVAVLPSDMLALCGVILYTLPLCGRTFWKNKRFYFLIFTPCLGAVLFYLPILPGLLQVIKVGSNESWNNVTRVLLAVFLPQLYTFAMLLLPVTAALFMRPFKYARICRGVIWLLPLFPILFFAAPPFPRVFFPLFPLFALLTAGGLRDFTARYCRLKRKFNPRSWTGGLIILALFWCCVQQQSEIKTLFSKTCGNAGRDDFYFPYYLRSAHLPDMTAQQAAHHETLRNAAGYYFTFDSDPWPLMFYLRLNGAAQPFLFDGPRGAVQQLPHNTAVILKKGEDQTALARRFPGNWHFVFENKNHQVWSYTNL